jgi:hypothetical protein
MKSLLLSVFLLIFSTTQLTAQQYENFVFNPRKYICHKATGTITVDGLMNEPDWQQQEWTEDFVDIEGATRPRPLQNTRVKMLWDENYFYVFARLEEKDIWATLTQRDTIIFQQNDFEVFIDPDGDTHHYYEFEMNALNTVWDLFLVKPYRDKGFALTGWDIAGLRSATHIEGTLNDPSDTDQYWNVEVAFPLKSLAEAMPGRRKPTDGDQWRINFSRVNWQTEKSAQGYQKKINPETGRVYPEYNWVWSEQGKINMHQPETWGYVQFTNERAGTKVAFNLKEEEAVKWKLRQLYYDQKKFFAIHHRYNRKTHQKGYKISVNPLGFLISYDSDYGTWNIKEDGKVWRSE